MMTGSSKRISCWATTFLMAFVFIGCAKGPLWRTGYLSPWVTKRWAEEERIAQTLFAKRENLRSMVAAAKKAGPIDQENAAKELESIIRQDPVLLLRIEAVKLLGQLQSKTAQTALAEAANDPNSQVRMAAVFACTPENPASLDVLQQVVGGDTDVDVRLAAARALSQFKGDQAVSALSLALEDPNPALQVRAADSLTKVTGKNLGRDIQAWRSFVQNSSAPQEFPEVRASAELPNSTPILK